MPRYAKAIIAQVDNLRSNNSKEALTLLAETFEHQSLNELSGPVLQPLVAILFVKSVSEKGFLRSLAQKAIRFIPLKSNPCILEELCSQTQAANGVISELAIKTMQ